MDGIGKGYKDLDNDRETLMEKSGHGQTEGGGKYPCAEIGTS